MSTWLNGKPGWIAGLVGPGGRPEVYTTVCEVRGKVSLQMSPALKRTLEFEAATSLEIIVSDAGKSQHEWSMPSEKMVPQKVCRVSGLNRELLK